MHRHCESVLLETDASSESLLESHSSSILFSWSDRFVIGSMHFDTRWAGGIDLKFCKIPH